MMGARFVSQARDEAEADDELARAFPNCSFTHLLTVISRDQISVAVEALLEVSKTGGRLDSLRLTRVAGKLEHRVRVAGLRPHQARTLSNRLAAVTGVEHASVEHQILQAHPTAGQPCAAALRRRS